MTSERQRPREGWESGGGTEAAACLGSQCLFGNRIKQEGFPKCDHLFLGTWRGVRVTFKKLSKVVCKNVVFFFPNPTDQCAKLSLMFFQNQMFKHLNI